MCLHSLELGAVALRACGHCFHARCLLETLQGARSSKRGGWGVPARFSGCPMSSFLPLPPPLLPLLQGVRELMIPPS